jgi:hypothetical protein
MTAADDTWRGRKGEQFSAKEWVGFWLPGCSLYRVEIKAKGLGAAVRAISGQEDLQAAINKGFTGVSK